MKLIDTPAPIVRSNNFRENKFSIQASSKAFTILSSSLYSNKYVAIVRELSTNAYDAHVAAGIGHVPIEVFLPNYLESTFSVRDYGTGIDPDEFEKIYTTYFYSTKTDTDEQVGCFGLGSKSPFAYTDQFSVENHYKGTKYVYSCFKNELGEPSIALITEVPTDSSGLKVSFDVKQSDRWDLEASAIKVLRWFDVTPKTNVSFSKDAKSDFCFKHNEKFYDGNPRIRMGQVVYPVDVKYFKHFLSSGESLIINVPIGYVDVTPSRESVEYTPRTIKALEKLSIEVCSFLTQSIKNIDSENITEWQKFNKRVQFCKDHNITFDTVFPNNMRGNTPYYVKITGLEKSNLYRSDNWKKRLEEQFFSEVYISHHYVIVIKDKIGRYQAKTKQLLTADKSQSDSKRVLLVDPTEKDILLANGFTEEDLMYLSKIQLPKEEWGSCRVARRKTNCCKLEIVDGVVKKVGTYLDPNKNSGYYIYEHEFPRIIAHWSSSNNLLVREIDKVEKEIYVFTTNQYVNLKIDKRNIPHVKEFMKEQLGEDVKSTVATIFGNEIRMDLVFLNMQRMLPHLNSTGSLIHDFLSEFDSPDYKESKGGFFNLANKFLQQCDSKDPIHLEVESGYQSLVKRHNEMRMDVYDKYPLLKQCLDNYVSDAIIKNVAQYVDLIESK